MYFLKENDIPYLERAYEELEVLPFFSENNTLIISKFFKKHYLPIMNKNVVVEKLSLALENFIQLRKTLFKVFQFLSSEKIAIKDFSALADFSVRRITNEDLIMANLMIESEEKKFSDFYLALCNSIIYSSPLTKKDILFKLYQKQFNEFTIPYFSSRHKTLSALSKHFEIGANKKHGFFAKFSTKDIMAKTFYRFYHHLLRLFFLYRSTERVICFYQAVFSACYKKDCVDFKFLQQTTNYDDCRKVFCTPARNFQSSIFSFWGIFPTKAPTFFNLTQNENFPFIHYPKTIIALFNALSDESLLKQHLDQHLLSLSGRLLYLYFFKNLFTQKDTASYLSNKFSCFHQDNQNLTDYTLESEYFENKIHHIYEVVKENHLKNISLSNINFPFFDKKYPIHDFLETIDGFLYHVLFKENVFLGSGKFIFEFSKTIFFSNMHLLNKIFYLINAYYFDQKPIFFKTRRQVNFFVNKIKMGESVMKTKGRGNFFNYFHFIINLLSDFSLEELRVQNSSKNDSILSLKEKAQNVASKADYLNQFLSLFSLFMLVSKRDHSGNRYIETVFAEIFRSFFSQSFSPFYFFKQFPLFSPTHTAKIVKNIYFSPSIPHFNISLPEEEKFAENNLQRYISEYHFPLGEHDCFDILPYFNATFNNAEEIKEEIAYLEKMNIPKDFSLLYFLLIFKNNKKIKQAYFDFHLDTKTNQYESYVQWIGQILQEEQNQSLLIKASRFLKSSCFTV